MLIFEKYRNKFKNMRHLRIPKEKNPVDFISMPHPNFVRISVTQKYK